MKLLIVLIFLIMAYVADIPIYTFLFIVPVVLFLLYGKPIKYDVLEVDNMDGIAFESYTVELFKNMGYKVHTTPATGDFGADLILQKGNKKTCVQCKRYKNNVGIEAVQQVIGSMKYYGATHGIVITNSYYTEAAKTLAAANKIELIDRSSLKRMINKYKSTGTNIYKCE